MVQFAVTKPATPSLPSGDETKWLLAHETLSRLAKCRAQLEWEEGHALLAAARAGVHRYLGFASFVEYVEVLFGYRARSVEEKLRVAEGLEALPLLSEELRTGRLNWSAVRELTRVATPDTEQVWRDFARGRTVRQLEDSVSGKKPGDRPETPADPALRKYVLAFEVRAETLATFREALAKLRRDAGGPLDEESALLLMARQVLGGPTDSGRANYQIAFTVCEHCQRGFQQGRGERFEVDPELAEMAECDAQYVCSAPAHGQRGPACELAAMKSAHLGNSPSALRAHVGGTPHANDPTPQTDASLPSQAADPHRRASKPKRRASQSIPPATRRAVMRRDGARCVVPGCRHAVFLDVHHVALRSEGGSHDPDSLVVLCAAHHRAVHRGALIVEGSVAEGLLFRHADGSNYRGRRLSPRSAAAQTLAFAALRRLGFREGEVRRALDALRADDEFQAGDAQQVVRAALRVLTPEHASTNCTPQLRER